MCENESVAVAGAGLNQLDLVTVRIFNKGNDRVATLHRAGLARDLAARRLDALAGRRDVIDTERDVP